MSKTQTTQSRIQKTTDDAGTELRSFTGTLYYASLREKDTKVRIDRKTGDKYDAPNAYIVQISVDDKTAEKLEYLGVQVKDKGTEQGRYVIAKSKKFQPIVIGPTGTKYASDVNEGGTVNEVPLIANGSTAEFTVSLYKNRESNVRENRGGKMCLGLRKVDFSTGNLIEYTTPEAKPL